MTPQQKSRSSISKQGSLNINTVIKYLQLLRQERSFSFTYANGPISYKMGFIKYKNWMMDKKLIQNRKITSKTLRGITTGRPYLPAGSFFKITIKGAQFLELIKNA